MNIDEEIYSERLRAVAKEETREHDSSVVRFLQVEEHLKRHINGLRRGAASTEKIDA